MEKEEKFQNRQSEYQVAGDEVEVALQTLGKRLAEITVSYNFLSTRHRARSVIFVGMLEDVARAEGWLALLRTKIEQMQALNSGSARE